MKTKKITFIVVICVFITMFSSCNKITEYQREKTRAKIEERNEIENRIREFEELERKQNLELELMTIEKSK